LGIAFHPGYADKSSPGAGKVYTYTSEPYSKSATNEGPIKTKRLDHQSVIREWNLPAGEDVIKGMGREVMRFDQPQFNHDGGAIAFGPDGMLYIGSGDGGGAHDKAAGHTSPGGNGQDLSKLLGKILRIDPLGQKGKKLAGRHSIPADNPFVGKAGANDAIWAYGLRNPYRMSFDRESGKLIVGDVGQNFIEEVNVIERGGNYGWRIMEGTFYFSAKGGEEGRIRKGAPSGKQPKMLPPALQYDHDEGISVIGGFVYRGKAIPQLQGKYVFGEWTKAKKQNQGRVLVGDLKTGKIEELYAAGKRVGGFVTGMGEDEAGELYVLTSGSKGPSGKSGKVHKIVAGN